MTSDLIKTGPASTLNSFSSTLLNYFPELKIEEGRVWNENDEFAVGYSPGWGAGWQSWNSQPIACRPGCVLLSLFLDKISYHEKEEFVKNLHLFLEEHSLYDQDAYIKDPLETLASYLVRRDLGIDKTEHVCTLGFDEGLTIAWLPKGTRFKIDEYDGNESLQTEYDVDGWMS